MEHIERVKRLAIIAMFSDDELMHRLVLKGGNALDIIFGLAARSSIDIDFSMPEDFSPAELEQAETRIERALSATFRRRGYQVFDVCLEQKPSKVSPDLLPFWGGYEVRFKIIEHDRARHLPDLQSRRRQAAVVGPDQKRTFTIDISKHEFCDVKEERQLDDFIVYVYPPELIALEKLRAICQQSPEYRRKVKSHFAAVARDFFDICVIVETYSLDLASPTNQRLTHNVFGAKRVPLRLLRHIGPFREDHRADSPSVENTVYPNVNLETFDYYFDNIVELGERLAHALGVV